MANITLGQLRDLWKNVSDWVTGVATHEPKVTLSGSSVIDDEIFNGSVGANTAQTVGVYTAELGELVGFVVNATSIAYLQLFPRSDSPSVLERAAHFWFRVPFVGTLYLPPIRMTRSYRVVVYNPQDSSQTVTVRRIRWFGAPAGAQAERIPLAWNLQIRDTATYIGTAGSGLGRTNMASVACLAGGNGPKPVYVKNGLNQEIQVNILTSPNSGFDTTIGTFTVPAGAATVKTNQDYPALDVPMPLFYLSIKASAAPTTGAVEAWTVFVMN